MNIFKTGPRFIKGYLETKRYTALKGQMEKLREAGDLRARKNLSVSGRSAGSRTFRRYWDLPMKSTAKRTYLLLRTGLS